MFEGLRQKLRESGPAGMAIAVGLLVVGLLIAFLALRSSFGPSTAARHNSQRVYICAETGKTFEHTAVGGKVAAVRSPHSGKDTGYPAQHCYWTADGKIKREPTYVLMNVYKGERGPTFCPDCNRMVPADNPVVTEGAPPPPTKEEYLKRGGSRQRDQGEDE